MSDFDRELFLSLCKKYNVPFSSEYKVPMIQEEDGTIRELTPEYLKQVLLQEELRVASNNKKINALREGIGRLTNHLDANWWYINNMMKDEPDEKVKEYVIAYTNTLVAVELLGGDWKRYENGKHKIFIAGVTDATEVDDD